MKLTLSLHFLAFESKFAVWLSKSVAASLDFLKSFDIGLQLLVKLPLLLARPSPRALFLLTISQLIELLLIHGNFFVLLGLYVYTLVQIADVLFEKLNELTSVLLIQIGRHSLAEMVLNGGNSALSLVLGQRLVHFVFRGSELVVDQLDLSILLLFNEVFGLVITVVELFIENHEKRFFDVAATLGLLKVRFLLDYLFISTVFVI